MASWNAVIVCACSLTVGALDLCPPQFDPVAYRLEPLVCDVAPETAVLMPHHRGRKRFHLGKWPHCPGHAHHCPCMGMCIKGVDSIVLCFVVTCILACYL